MRTAVITLPILCLGLFVYAQDSDDHTSKTGISELRQVRAAGQNS